MAKRSEVQVLRIIYVFILVGLSLWFASPFVIPIILAATIALALYPLQVRLEKREWSKARASALITTLFTVVVSIPFLFFVAKGSLLVTDQLEKFSNDQRLQDQGMEKVVNTLQSDIVRSAHKYLTKFPMAEFLTEEKLNTYLKSGSNYALDFMKTLAMSIPDVVLALVILVLCIYSFLTHAASVRNFFQEIFGFSNRKMDQLIGIFLRDSREVYVSNIVTGAIQSVIVATAVFFVIETDWFLVFFVTLIFSFVPVIGAAPMAFLFAVVAFFQDNVTGAIILTVVSGFSGIIDNILRPWLASFGESKAPGAVSFIAVIGGALVLGFPGLFIGLLVGSIAYDTLPIFWEEIDKGESGGVRGFFSFGDKSKPDEEISKH